MTSVSLSTERRLELMTRAETLASKLASVSVARGPARGGSRGGSDRGIRKNCVERVVANLYAETDLKRFREFLRCLGQIDAFEAQNERNPRMEYQALGTELVRLPDLHSLDEWRHLLGWCARLMVDRQPPRSMPSQRGRQR